MSDATHQREVVVWDVPSVIERGARFRIRVGVRCNGGCLAHGWRVDVFDHDNRPRAEASLGSEPWVGTDALRYAEIELAAPAAEGLHVWRAVASALDDSLHASVSADFNVCCVRESEYTLTVIAIDQARQMPIRGARVVVHPYRAVTGDDGVAVLRVPRGSYRLFVSGRDYFPFRADGDVQADLTIEAELQLDRGPTDAELWS